MYSMKNIDGKESNTAKGKNIATEFNEFKDTLFNKKVVRHKMKIIQSKKHKIGTYEVNKILLLYFDDKRLNLDDDIHTFAYFNKDCKKLEGVLKDFLQMIINKRKFPQTRRFQKRFSQKKKKTFSQMMK